METVQTSTNLRMAKLWYIHTMGTTQQHKPPPHDKNMNLTDIILS